MKSNYKKIGSYIQLVDKRNNDLNVNTLLGLTVDKIFIPSVANIVGSDMSKYKIIKKGQFACSLMQVRRDGKIPVALLTDFGEAIISQAYPVFKIIDEGELLPEYLMMWMSRSEFDREACFYAVGGVRGSLEWEDFCNMELPVPAPDKQQQIVDEYNTIVKRIKLNKQLSQKLEETAQAIYKHWFVDFEFPITAEYAQSIGKPELEGKPYKSSGGEMFYDEGVDQDIPQGWSYQSYTSLIDLRGGGTPKTEISDYWDGEIPFFTPKDIGKTVYTVATEKNITKLGLDESSTKLYAKNTVFITARGTVGAVAMPVSNMAMNQSCYAAIGKDGVGQYFVHQHTLRMLKCLINEANGGVFGALVTRDFDGANVAIPTMDIIKLFEEIVCYIYESLEKASLESILLLGFKDTVLSKMTKVEVN